MSNKHYLNKLKAFKKYVNEFIEQKKSSVDDVHDLRVKSRELFSLLSAEEPFYKRVKKVIKISNEIRDLDVFVEGYLESLPKKFKVKLDMKSIMESVDKSRYAEVEKLHEYLKSLVISNSVEFITQDKEIEPLNHTELDLNQIELHKYRVYIKKILFREKNSLERDEKKIKTLTKIKDILGSINDNSNGLNRLSEQSVEADLLKDIEEFTQKQNLKLFKEFQKQNDKYIKALL